MKESSAIAGSGIQVLREVGDVRIMRGINNVVLNYEDFNSLLGIPKSSSQELSYDEAVQITPPETRLRGRRRIIIQNPNAEPIFIGDHSVTPKTGLKILPDQHLTLDVLDYGDIYSCIDKDDGIVKNPRVVVLEIK